VNLVHRVAQKRIHSAISGTQSQEKKKGWRKTLLIAIVAHKSQQIEAEDKFDATRGKACPCKPRGLPMQQRIYAETLIGDFFKAQLGNLKELACTVSPVCLLYGHQRTRGTR
jgi:hypothetical protein